MRRGASVLNIAAVALGLAFLYLPITILVIFSFNASRLVTIWGGWSLTWYRELLHDDAVLEAAWISLRVAFSRQPQPQFLAPWQPLPLPAWADSAVVCFFPA